MSFLHLILTLDVAEKTFNRCVTTNEGNAGLWEEVHADSRNLEVKLNYEFLEDFQDEQSSNKQSSDEEGATNIDTRYTPSAPIFLSSLNCNSLRYCDALSSNSTKSWQPKKFTKHNHPLFLIVSSPVFLVLHSLLVW